jgi:hypothetical protein
LCYTAHFLPPYAPDLNPDEFVWNYLKGTGVAKKPLRKNESLKERVHADLDKLKQNQRLLRSFFMVLLELPGGFSLDGLRGPERRQRSF